MRPPSLETLTAAIPLSKTSEFAYKPLVRLTDNRMLEITESVLMNDRDDEALSAGLALTCFSP